MADDLRTHWMRTVHEALCGLSAKRLMLGERIIGGECATADVTCHGCRAVLRLAAMDAASGGPDDLRTLAQAVVDAPSWATVDAMRAVLLIDAAPRDTIASGLAQARAILAALDAADAQGYARAMGEVVALDEPDPCPICNVADWAGPRTTTGCGRARLRTQSFRALATLCAHNYCASVRVCT